MKLLAGLAVLAALALAGCGGDDDATHDTEVRTTERPATTQPAEPPQTTGRAGGRTDGEVSIVEVVDDVEYYNPCQNSPARVDGEYYYIIPTNGWRSTIEYPTIDVSRYPLPEEPHGFVRIAPPGPGDDVGTFVIYSDGIARYETDSGMVSWFTDEELSYDWDC